MGAVPSRESLQRGLCPIPNYGQRQQIILIPLTKEFFPSADCPLMEQFCEARNDPFVRYYHCYGEDLTPNSNNHDNNNNDNNKKKKKDEKKKEDCECAMDEWSAETFPSSTCTPAALYDAYVCRAGESQLFDTDQAMFTSYAENPQQLRPIPCAVAFAYHPGGTPHSTTTTTGPVLGCGNNNTQDNHEDGDIPHGVAGDDGEGSVRSVGAAQENHPSSSSTHAVVHNGSVVRGCVDVCGWRVHVVGFFGDVSALHPASPTTTTTTPTRNNNNNNNNINESVMRLQMFISKSVGDHNCMHVLYAALYTYVIQWREAAMNALRECRSLSETITQEESSPTSLSDTAVTLKTLNEIEIENENENNNNDDDDDDEMTWPPLCDVITTCRRSNVPMLCFQRSVRAMFMGMGIVSEDVRNTSLSEMDNVSTSLEANNTTTLHEQSAVSKSAPLGISRSDGSEEETRVHYNTTDGGALEEKFMTMWLEDNILFARIPEEVASSAVHYVVDCISRNEHPLGVLQTKLSQHPSPPPLVGSYEIGIRQSTSHAENGNSSHSSNINNTTTTATTITTNTSMGLTGNDIVNERAFKVVKGTCTVRIAVPQFPDELVVVESWPEEGISVSELKALACKHMNTHLYWVVGVSEAAQRTAAATFAAWKSNEMPIEISNTHTESIVKTTDSITSTTMIMTMSVGESLHLVAFSSKTEEQNPRCPSSSPTTNPQHKPKQNKEKEEEEEQQQQHQKQQQEGILERGRFPLEELLLAELRNTSKQAREADVHAPNWVRCSDKARTHAGVQVPTPPADSTDISETQAFMAAVAQLVGDGPLCLWRVPLTTGAVRVIAVTPKFVRPTRKKRIRRRPAHQRTHNNTTTNTTNNNTTNNNTNNNNTNNTNTNTNHSNSNKKKNDDNTLFTTMDRMDAAQELSLIREHAIKEQIRHIPSPPLSHQQNLHIRVKSDHIHSGFTAPFLGLSMKAKNAFPTPTFGDNLTEQQSNDATGGDYHKRSLTQVSCVSSTFSSHAPPWDGTVNFWPSSGTNDQMCFSPTTLPCPTGNLSLSPQQLRIQPFENTMDHRINGVFCLGDQSLSSHFDMGSPSHANGGFNDFNAFLISSRSGTPSERDGRANGAINVTVHHGRPHYRTPSSINFSDTASNHDGSTAKGHTTTNTTKPQSLYGDTFRLDWRRSKQQDD
ncbi:uncharacterized protein TM35_000261590 [Trypanosoma theileri]|uniref:Uncharacterized protein n=1 Tax=Trypanosoma theileri TaxID=67003 RepID=A0A1X0NPU8_9TRYP|nr:uncharacterized protein TM35_000261590 [Trypanosoma theileri]ORC86707.1 hypothetical protein TM35_000261590 [Trypanosoma theileri]